MQAMQMSNRIAAVISAVQLIIFALAGFTVATAIAGDLPDPNITPGLVSRPRPRR
jgi:hypothetical protein